MSHQRQFGRSGCAQEFTYRSVSMQLDHLNISQGWRSVAKGHDYAAASAGYCRLTVVEIAAVETEVHLEPVNGIYAFICWAVPNAKKHL